ncbi:hypothetical protein AB0L40_07605 [Patulibacter sp. NPDC049589]|uniref:hypothetical protein n=1 Tax=Patulibacter sp. NPDC049589 TaxID=3154731 RepID=UPI00342AF097
MLFTTADDVHDSLGRLMEELATDSDVGLRLSRLDTVVQLRYRNPDTKVTLVAREGDAPTVHLGEVPQGTPNPEVILTLDADTGHLLWLGRQNVAIGIARGAIQAKGETRKVVDLLSLTTAIAPHYEHLLRATGREALLDPDAGYAVEEAPADEAAPDAEGAADGAEVTGTEGEAAPESEGTTPDAEATPDVPAEGDAPAADPTA